MRGVVLVNFVIASARTILLLTATSKLVTVIIGGRLLKVADPLLGIANWVVLLGVAILELGILLAISGIRDKRISCLLVTLMGGQFVAYRAAFAIGGFSRGCPCLGRLGEWLPVTDLALDRLLWFAAFFLFLGGIVALLAAFRLTPASPPQAFQALDNR